jgi:hypothetical protein
MTEITLPPFNPPPRQRKYVEGVAVGSVIYCKTNDDELRKHVVAKVNKLKITLDIGIELNPSLEDANASGSKWSRRPTYLRATPALDDEYEKQDLITEIRAYARVFSLRTLPELRAILAALKNEVKS